MKPKPQKLSPEELKKIETMSAEKPSLMEYAHHVGSFSIQKLNVEEMKNQALQAMYEQTEMQLQQIYEQVELLAKQARDIKERSEISRRIYKAKISFKPLPGNTYFLYEDQKSKDILSMISPEEWGERCTYKFLARVRLLSDHTWKIIGDGSVCP